MEKQKIYFGYRGNGLCVWTECGRKPEPDFQAHIQPTREVTYYQDNTPDYFKEEVEKMAKYGNSVLRSGSYPVLALNPLNKPTKYCDTRFYGRKLISEEIADGEKIACLGRQIVDNWKNLRNYDPDKNDAVYFIIGRFGKGAYRCYGYSFSEETANAELSYFTKRYCDIGYDIQVERHDEKFLLQCGEKAGVNLDFED